MRTNDFLHLPFTAKKQNTAFQQPNSLNSVYKNSKVHKGRAENYTQNYTRNYTRSHYLPFTAKTQNTAFQQPNSLQCSIAVYKNSKIHKGRQKTTHWKLPTVDDIRQCAPLLFQTELCIHFVQRELKKGNFESFLVVCASLFAPILFLLFTIPTLY